ncbi:uncharacterized protein LOC131284770 [Anopheles ziemanni]|uniref:uncharacterized protein LOC131261388 n=1 Tax=Anopheles coustani TaxID=139045 RepID=UPI00265888BD|nr:uncharacterized protein LOC131261388 [Anopheles coustani]XP_058169611.1 uncharacterized protein LOC131284770 [Anopheles ziemanni]
MFPVRAIVFGVLWASAGAEAFWPLLTNIYLNGQGRSSSSSICDYYNLWGSQGQNRNPGGNGGGNGWPAGWGATDLDPSRVNGNTATLPGILGLLNRVYPSSVRGTSQSGRPGVVVRVEETNPRGNRGGSNTPSTASTSADGSRELDYYDQDAPYYYEDDGDYYGQDYTYSDPDEDADTVVYYDTLLQTETPPTVVQLLQTLYGTRFGTPNTAGSNACGACAASMLNMLMGK